MKEVNIEKYIKDYEEGKISPWRISVQENVSDSTIKKQIKKYYEEQGKEKPKVVYKSRKKQIDIKKYIHDYEEGKISPWQIALKENLGETTIRKRIIEYYEEQGKERPTLKFKRRKKEIDVEKYISDYEEKRITVKEIALKENVSKETIRKRINECYEQKGSENPFKYAKKQLDSNHSIQSKTICKGEISKNALNTIKAFLKRGLTREEIIKIAEKRKIVIPDELFQQLSKEINNEEEQFGER